MSKSLKKNESVGLLFGYHEKMYKDDAIEEKPTFVKQCYSSYCAPNGVTSWVIAISIVFIVMGTLATLLGCMLPAIYISWNVDINSNLTMARVSTGDNNRSIGSRFETETKLLNDIYRARDLFVIVGLCVLFVGGLVMSFALLAPLCVVNWSRVKRPASPTSITVTSELDQGYKSTDHNGIKSYTEEEF
eukprot:gene4627-5234_t